MEKAYNHKIEEEIYKIWENSGYFNPDNLNVKSTKEKFVISMPPPNATGELHMGHAMMLALEDLMIRFNRMLKKKTLWLPGIDHASIATQNKVEKELAKKGKTRFDFSREEFLKIVEDFVEKSKKRIEYQIRRIGSSCDWSRERYTLDKGLSKAVKFAFLELYNAGLIYRGKRIVNWCPRCKSTLADDEVEYILKDTVLYTFKYSKDFPIPISTVRPETKLGDTAVAVNPDDNRYKKFVGKIYKVNFLGVPLKLKIIADKLVDKTFGTGALGVTPGHSIKDFELAEKYNLKIVSLIDEDGKIKQGFSEFSGLNVESARRKIIKKLKNNSLLIKEEKILHNLSVCYRCSTSIEPLISDQWFIDVNKKFKFKDCKLKRVLNLNKTSLKNLAYDVVDKGLIKIIPKRFEKEYFRWIENLRDWCISRQIWFGHQIPVWYKKSNFEIYVGINPPKGKNWEQDLDTLDTWFSSALWTFSTLGWPDKTKDLKEFHPTTVLETGYDILFFWVARMIIMTTYLLGDIPFKYVYLHGLIRDKLGRKMSKSLGNGIDPVEMSDKYGADAVRLALLMDATPGNDIRMYEDKIAGYRNFVNKLWNIGRFLKLTSVATDVDFKDVIKNKNLDLFDKWILSRFNKLVKEVNFDLKNFKFSYAGNKLKNFTWYEFADWYIEISKIKKSSVKFKILNLIFRNLLKLWHPFVPFVTEKLWNELGFKGMLMIQEYPKQYRFSDEKAELNVERIKELVGFLRKLKKEFNIKEVQILDDFLIKDYLKIIQVLARLKVVAIKKPEFSISLYHQGFKIFINKLTKSTIYKMKKERDEIFKYIKKIESQFKNKKFLEKAPLIVKNRMQENLKQAKEKIKFFDKILNAV